MARPILLLCCSLLSLCLNAQSSDQDKLREAKVFFSHQRYAEALSTLSATRQLAQTDGEARFLMGVCQYQTNRLDEAYRTMTTLTANNKPPYPECWLYLAKILHAQHRFKEASDQYKHYLRGIYPNDPNRRMVIEEIRRCANGIEIQFQTTNIFTENLGPEVNTEWDEFAPIASPSHGDRIYFSAIRPQNTGGARNAYGNPDPQWGNYFSDLFSTRVVRGMWSEVKPMHYLLNSPKHEILLGFGADGQTLYYFKGWDQQRGEVVVDTFRDMDERTLSSTPLPAPLRPHEGDNYPVFYRDTLMIFASNRRGGYGGWDLYKVSKRDGRWMLPENLGPTINTAFDETTPFLANDGQTLYFSSNDSKKSIGGLDVFKAYFIPERNIWLPPENVGIPINSAADDAFFKIAQDGFTAFFASSRKDGYGKRDVYAAFFQDFPPEMEYPEGYFDRDISSNQSTVLPPASSPVKPAVSEPPSTQNPLVENGFEDPPQAQPIPAPPVVGTPEPVRTSIVEPTPPAVDPVRVYGPVPVNGRVLADAAYDMLDRLSDELIRQRDLRLVLTAYHRREKPTGLALFRAIEKAEAVATYLLRKGVAAEQLFMRGLLSKDDLEAPDEVEIAFAGPDGTPPPADLPALGDEAGGADLSLAINTPLHYKIQVASAKRALDADYLEGFPNPMIEKTPDFEYYRYTLGAFTNRSEAENFIQKAKATGRTSAYLATYQRGWRTKR